MNDKEKTDKNEFDPEKHKEIKKGPLKPVHKNQYGEKPGGIDRHLSERATAEKHRENKDKHQR